METKDHKVGAATCRVRRTNAVPATMREGIREVACLQVPASEQGKGYATSLMHSVCREADAAGIVLVLWPQPFGDHIAMGKTQLIDWYARTFGFQVIQPDPVLMARMPGSTPRLLRLNPTIEALHS
jgi:N-acetylglutamate synthase-like GNAT family acetyltransferase